MHLFLIPGLGFDQRIFDKLELGDHQLHYINWIEPVKEESMTAYAGRMATAIPENIDELVIIGHSLGGIVAQEIAAQRPVSKIILLSSIKSRKENPFHFRMMRATGMYRVFTKGLVHRTIRFWGPQHGYEKGADQQLVKDMVNGYSNYYLQWALRQLSIWPVKRLTQHTKLVQIHGSKDKTLLSSLIKNADHMVSGAGHFMVYKQADKISHLILQEL